MTINELRAIAEREAEEQPEYKRLLDGNILNKTPAIIWADGFAKGRLASQAEIKELKKVDRRTSLPRMRLNQFRYFL